jgi:RNA polymerase sigma factor (sigma-70 family)
MFFKKKIKEKDMINELKNNSEDALVQLYNDNYTSIRNLVFKNSGKEIDVEDVLQEAVVVVWQNVKKTDFVLTAKLSTYLYSVARFIWLKKLKKTDKLDSWNENLSENSFFEFSSFASSENKEIILGKIDKLDSVCKQLLVSFYFYEKDMNKIASEMGFANSNVAKSKKYQCFKKLQESVLSSYSKSDFF